MPAETARDDDSSRPPAKEATRLTILYVVALSTVAVLSVGAQLLIQWRLSDGESDSRVINVAGRQRMLSQRLAKSALLMRTQDTDRGPTGQGELAKTLDEWSVSHRALQEGDKKRGLPGNNSPEVAELFDAIKPHFDAMRLAAETLAALPPESMPDESAIATISRHESDFLAGMDAIVSRYVVEAESKVARLRRLESAILALTLAVLLAEGLLIFRPAVRRIEHTVARLGAVTQRLRIARDQAEEANNAKSRFLANISHELRTPMTAVLGMTELARDEDNAATRESYLAIVQEAGGSLLSLLNDLIDLSSIDAGQIQMVHQPFSPSEVVQRVARIMRAAAQEKQLELTATSRVTLDYRVLGDPGRLEQVLLNLVANAIKSTPSGKVSVDCTLVESDANSALLSYSVRDTGIGIAPADQQRIFEPFVQADDGRASAATGAGLGLAICRKIAEAMDAKITVLSTRGVGTTLTFSAKFPLCRAARGQELVREGHRPPPSLRILVVEDTRVNQVLLRQLLARDGHVVTVVSDGEHAIEACEHEGYDAVLIDFQLPAMSGSETAKELRRLEAELGRPPAPLICVTAHVGNGSEEWLQATEFNAVVTKPIDRIVLLETLASLTTGEPTAVPSGDGAEVVKGDAPPAVEEADFVRQLADAYLRVADEQREELEAAINDGRLAEAKLITHRLRSQVGYFHEEALIDHLMALEAACEGERGEDARRQLPRVMKGLSELNGRLAALAPGALMR